MRREQPGSRAVRQAPQGRREVYTLAAAALLLGVTVAAQTTPSAPASPPTFSKDVLPILQKNCQSCHRPGQMPPGFADPAHGRFANDRSLAAKDIETITKWANAGAPQGDPADAPPPVVWPSDGWQIKPDIVVKGPEFRVPAHTPNDVVEWVTYVFPSGFTRDTWITSLEIKPSVLSVTHHICFTFQRPRPNTKYYEANWSESPRDAE